MAHDVEAAARVRRLLSRRKGFSEKKMFGGVAFLLHGHMCCGIVNVDLVLRLGEDGAGRALEKTHTRPMDFTGTPLKSMVYVAPAGYRSDAALKRWVDSAVEFVRTLPPKPRS